MEYKSFPTSHTWVASLASEYAKEVIEEKKSLIKDKLVQVLQFSITTDKLNRSTSTKNICNLHLEGENHRVALIRIKGLHPTKKGAKLHCAVT